MSVSKRIEDQVQKLDVNRSMKRLMLDILDAESKGSSKYKTIYDKKIEDYVNKNDKKGE